jgi:hypothetical protein
MQRKTPCGCGSLAIKSGPLDDDDDGGGVNQTCHGFLGGVSGHQGHVVTNPRIVVIYWDQYFTDTPAAVTSMGQFVSDLATGGYWDGLRQYGVGSASVAGHAVINMKTYPTPNSQNAGKAFSEAQMQSQLITWLNAGVVTPKPAGNEENLVYLIVAPSDTTLSLGGKTGGFCGYHQHGKDNASTGRDNLIWATVQGYSKATTGQAFVDSISYCVSHELTEAFSNPDGQGFFNDTNGCEIGDVCEATVAGALITVTYKTWKVENYWSNLDGKCTIGPLGPRYAAHTNVAASQQFGLSQTDVFAINNNGAMNVVWVVNAGVWVGAPLGQAGHFPAGAPVAASQQIGLSQTDIFAIDKTGTMNVMWVVNAGAWNGPAPLGPAGKFPPGGLVAASQQIGLSQTDVFAVDKNGTLNVMWVVNAGAWSGPAAIGPAGKFPPGAPVAVSRQFGLNQTDVFVVDKTGTLNVMWVVGAGAWQGPAALGPAGHFPPGAPVAASEQIGLSQTDVFVVDKNGTLNVLWVVNAGNWNGPATIGPAGKFPTGAPIAVSRQFGLNQTDVFVVDKNGTMNVLWVVGAGAWNGPAALGPVGKYSPGAPIAASQQFGLSQTDVFAVDKNGALDVLWVVNAGAWAGPGQIAS